jgi:MoaA/NifB/PqqE/SkfB family radical SAM enzyme
MTQPNPQAHFPYSKKVVKILEVAYHMGLAYNKHFASRANRNKGFLMMYYHVLKSAIQHKLGLVPRPYFVTFFITQKCNLKCFFCDVWRTQKQARPELSTQEIIDMFAKLKRIDVVRISGGEPFLRKDMTEVVNGIDRVTKPRIIHFTTNGTFPDRIRKAVEGMNNPHKIHIKVSIDAIGERHNEIRGVKGSYEKCMETIKELLKAREKSGFHVGVNQAIVNEADVQEYYNLKKMLGEHDVPVYPSIAHEPGNALYTNEEFSNDSFDLKPVGDFTPEALKEFTDQLIADSKNISDFKERMIDRYHLKGLQNRLTKGLKKPFPRCVALTSHVRILPNGDIPVCFYNGKVVGNLHEQTFEDLWYHTEKMNKEREWVNNCSGCWQSCESAVSAVYTGDIIKGLFG